jgi:hypothetical protein
VSVTITSVRRAATRANAWEIRWSTSTAGTRCYVYRDGEFIGSTLGRSMIVTAPEGLSPVVEIFDVAPPAGAPRAAYPRRATFAWSRGLSDSPLAAAFRVEEYVDSAWALRRQITPEPGQTYFQWSSPVLPDGVTTQYRVVPVSAAGAHGAALAFPVLMVRVPDPPSVRFTYTPATGLVTVAAAS